MGGRQIVSLLEGYRVLDLTEGWHLFCGKIIGDMGADVIKIEKPGGSPSRFVGPFYKDIPDPEKSLFWFSYNANKRSITLDIETADGKEIFKQLVKQADILIESFPPGHMERLGLDYAVLSEINSKLIMVSISRYGQTGPYAHMAASDITTWAMGGHLYPTGHPYEEPVWYGYPQSGLVASTHAASAAMLALWFRSVKGEGQYIDVSEQQSVAWLPYGVTMNWRFNKMIVKRLGGSMPTPTLPLKTIFPCKDGQLCIALMGGGNPVFVNSCQNLVKWMDEKGMAPEWLKQVDWAVDYNASNLKADLLEKVNAAVEKFFLTVTKAEVFRQSIERKIIVAPINSTQDIVESEQLKARDFWVMMEHPELEDKLLYCGPFIKLSEAPITIRRRPPLVGEHNDEVYHHDLGMSREALVLLKQAAVI